MKRISEFAKFCTPGLDVLEQYSSPEDESSVIKGVPVHLLDYVREQFRRAGYLDGRRFRVHFRGPRYDLSRGYCRRQDAHSFAVYERT